MKLVTYTPKQTETNSAAMQNILFGSEQKDTPGRLGVIAPGGERVIDVAASSADRLPADMRTFLRTGAAGMDIWRDVLAGADDVPHTYPLDAVTLLAPIYDPSKVMAIGRNYEEHALEQKRQPPSKPLIFAIYPSAIIGPDETITWHDTLTQQVDFEGELAAVIGRVAHRVSESEALDYVAGYTICNDVSARDLQYGDKQYTRGKSLDTFCPLGPWLVTADEIPDPQALAIQTRLNGKVMQEAPTADMIFSVRYLVSYISHAFTLYPGDIITTGTPGGVGVFREPPLFLQDGDVVQIDIEGIGSLSNPCRII